MGQTAQVTHHGIFDLQVCVPEYWSDDQVLMYVQHHCPCGTNRGWRIRKQGDYEIPDQLERQPCEERPGFVHVMLDA